MLKFSFKKIDVKTLVLVPLLIHLIALACFIENTYSISDFPLDDAWIHRVYSRSFAMGHGFAYNPGQQEAGSTSPLWSIVTCPAHWFEFLGTETMVLMVKAFGVLLTLATLTAIFQILMHLTSDQLMACFGAAVFALDPRLLFSSLSGMETNLLLFLWTSATAALLYRRFLLAFFLLGLTTVTRPEAGILVLACFPAWFQYIRSDKSILLKIIVCSIIAGPLLLWTGFCEILTGHLLPNTFYIKAGSFHFGILDIQTAWEMIFKNGLTSWYLFLIGIFTFIWQMSSRNSKDRLDSIVTFCMLIIAPILYLIGVIGSRTFFTDGYYWTRWTDPAALILMVCFCAGFACLLSMLLTDNKTGHRYVKIGCGGLAVLILLGSLPAFSKGFANKRHHLASDSRAVFIMNVQPGKWIDQHTAKESRIGVNDAGAIRYFGHRFTIDLFGLNDADLAFGKTTQKDAIQKADWLVILTDYFIRTNLWPDIDRQFVPRAQFRIPLKEYTVCDCPEHTRVTIFQKK